MNDRDILRKELFEKRISPLSGKFFSPPDKELLHEYVCDMSPDMLRAAAKTAARKLVEPDLRALRNELTKTGAANFAEATDASRAYLFVINTSAVDLERDIIYPKGVSLANFGRNGIVPFQHDTTKLPVAGSDMPFMSGGDKLLAVARFPEPGVSAESDQVEGAIRAGLIRGASVGIIPTRWSFSKDPARPLGVDILESILLEWSCVGLPCNQQCLLVGPVSNKSANDTTSRNAHAREQRLAEARSLRDSISPGSKTGEVTTRQQRLAEAAKIRRMVYSI